MPLKIICWKPNLAPHLCEKRHSVVPQIIIAHDPLRNCVVLYHSYISSPHTTAQVPRPSDFGHGSRGKDNTDLQRLIIPVLTVLNSRGPTDFDVLGVAVDYCEVRLEVSRVTSFHQVDNRGVQHSPPYVSPCGEYCLDAF